MAASSDQPATAAWTDIVKTAAAAVTTSPGPTSLAGGYPRSNPLYSIVDGFTSIVLAFFAFIKSILSFSTVTIPHACFTVLHYSLTLQLTFPSLLVLFLAALVASLFWLRHKHRSYERLKEAPLKTDEGFNLHPELNQQGTDQKQGPFHTYLDELLQAIRIFGFLEKPVFHELARHLQTRRILAGDSLSLDSDSSFYIVIDGRVQVFAPISQQDAGIEGSVFDDDESPGLQLLNEVESGGTLSSLFTILSLFAEDVHLGTSSSEDSPPHPMQHHPLSTEQLRRRASAMPPGSEQLQLNAAALRQIPTAGSFATGLPAGADTGLENFELSNGGPRHHDTEGTDDGTIMGTGQDNERGSSPIPPAVLPPAQGHAPGFLQPAPPSPVRPRVASQRANSIGRSQPDGVLRHDFSFPSPRYNHARSESLGRPHTPGSITSAYSMQTNRTAFGYGTQTHAPSAGGAQDFPRPGHGFLEQGIGTIGRATTDTTLAVIPAEAFKRLTKKYPSSAAHIVQVILTRLSRVTFHTAHQYLGLTKEIMRTERRINEVASFPLPPAFYEQGGIEKLRQRFLPEPKRQRGQHDKERTREASDDYFRQRAAVTPDDSPQRRHSRSSWTQSSDDADDSHVPTITSRSRPPTTPWGHPDPPLRTPLARTSVGPGDLLSMTGNDDMTRHGSPAMIGDRRQLVSSPVKSPPSAPGSHFRSSAGPQSDQSRRQVSLESLDQHDLAGTASAGVLSEARLKDDILECISKAVGLQAMQPASPHAGYEASPFLNPSDGLLHKSVFNSAFSSLSMLDGMMFDDETSSITGGSSLAGVHHTELENEVEVKFFPAGSTLVKAGESRAGLFYVIDGFLDVFVPADENLASKSSDVKGQSGSSSQTPSHKRRAEATRGPARTMAKLNEQLSSGTTTKTHSRDTTQTSRRRDGSFASSTDPLSLKGSPLPVSSKFGNALDGTQQRKRPVSSSTEEGSNAYGKGERGAKAAGPPNGSTRSSDTLGPQMPVHRRPIYSVGRGGLAGYLSSLLGSASFVDIQAKTDVYVGYLPAKALERIMESRPSTLLTLSKRLLTLLSPLILHIDSALDWQQVNAGHVIFREGEPSDSFYIVINGRLRAISDKEGTVDVLGEYGQGDSVGELDVITSSPRQKTLHAIRDSELVRMPMTLFNAVAVRHPQIAIQISRIIARRVRQEVEKKQAAAHTMRSQIPGLPDLGRNNANLKTVAILPVTREVPIVDFANKLQAAFEDTIGGPTAFLNQSSVMSILGRHAFNRMGKLKLAGWLAEQEQKYRLVLYVVDTVVSSPWAQTSIRQADSVLLVGFGDDPAVGEYERLLLGLKTTARKELVLLHPERSVPPGSTREWLKSRPWINAHHHVEMPGITRSHAAPMTTDPTAVQALRNLKEKLETSLQRYRIKGTATAVHGRPHHFSDFARLARRLCGKSIGLVLGGGGARGCAHVGVIQALEERGIPIDMIGGTSIGSLIGGLYAKEGEVVSSYGRAKKFSGRMGSLWRFASDLTYPVVSYTTGHEFNRGIFKALADTHIEDMWLPFFCNTTNITWSRMEVHTTGYAWRYIRGSMTLAGLIPPLVDEGNMLVDGGYVDNLPVSVMLALGAKSVFAVDVGSIDDTSPRSYGDTLSGWWVLLNKWNPWSDARNIPSIPDIQGRLTYVSSVKTLEEAKRIPGCFYMRMPVEGFGTLEFGAFNEISRIGYAAGSKMLDEWAAESKLPTGIEQEANMNGSLNKRRGGVSARRNSV